MTSLFKPSDFGPERGMHGAAASAQVSYNSDFGPQGIRQSEYISLARQCDDNIQTLKSLRANFLRCAGTTAGNDTDTTLGQFNATMRKARIQLSKSEAADEDGEREDASTACQNAAKLLQRAAKLLAAAEEDVESEEDDAALESAKTAYRKCKARLTALKAKTPAPAAAPAAGTPAAVQEAAKALDKQVDVLKGQLAEVVEMIGSRSRGAGVPPNFAVIKSEAANTDEPTSIRQRIAHLQDTGIIDVNTAIEAKGLANRLALVKSGQGDLEEFRHHLARSRGVIKDDIFKDV
jgi:hypothetical protein